jgi:hypothetical protein
MSSAHTQPTSERAFLCHTLTGLVLILVLLPAAVAADSAQSNSGAPSKLREESYDRTLQTVATPGLDSEVTGATSSVNLEAVRDKESVSVVLTRALTSSSPERNRSLLKLSLKGPIGKDATEAELVTLDGLENFVTASLGYTYTLWPSPNGSLDESTYAKQSALCAEYARVNRKPYDSEEHDCTEQFFDPKKPRGAELKDRFELLAWGTKPIQLFGVEASYGQAVFQYLNPENLEKGESTEYANAVSLYAGLLQLRTSKEGRARSDVLVFAGYRREETYTAGEATELCTPLGETGAERCDDVVLGGPSRKERDLAFIELRRFFFGEVPIGVSPRLTYDFEEDITGVELPIYFLTDAAGGLIGGVRAAWTSESDEVSLAAFVGKKLDFSSP